MKQDPEAFWRRYTKPLGSQAWALEQFYVARWFGIFIASIAAVFVLVSAFRKLITAPLDFLVDAIGGAGHEGGPCSEYPWHGWRGVV